MISEKIDKLIEEATCFLQESDYQEINPLHKVRGSQNLLKRIVNKEARDSHKVRHETATYLKHLRKLGRTNDDRLSPQKNESAKKEWFQRAQDVRHGLYSLRKQDTSRYISPESSRLSVKEQLKKL